MVEINISEKITKDFVEMYDINLSRGIENIIVIKTFKSELNSIMTERVFDNEMEKFSLTDFWRYLNLKYVSREVVNDYKTCKVLISKRGEELLLEVVDNNKQKVGQQIFIRSE